MGAATLEVAKDADAGNLERIGHVGAPTAAAQRSPTGAVMTYGAAF